MVPVRLQAAWDYGGADSTAADLNHLQSSPDTSDDASHTCTSGTLRVVLHNHSLWLQFYREQTEMIINKPGRRMFPLLVYKIHGMNPVARYRVFLEILPVDLHHWSFQNGKWSQCEKTENNMLGNHLYIHPDSPNTGAHWMKKEIKFNHLKVTNSKETINKGKKMILLHSLHKYQPRLCIEEVNDGEHETSAPSFTHNFTFPETEFITVTAYQNIKVSQLKIKHNPFAKGFREKYYFGKSVNKYLTSEGSTARTTNLPKTDSDHSSMELKEGSSQDNSPLSPGLLAQSAQPLPSCAYDSSPSSSNVMPLGMNAMEHGFPPSTSPPTIQHNLHQDFMVPQENWPLSSSSNSTSNSGNGLHSISTRPMDTITRTEEEKQLEQEFWVHAMPSYSNNSGHSEEGSNKRSFFSDDSEDEMCSRGKRRKQHAGCLTSLEFSTPGISTENASSVSIAGLGEGACQVMDEMPVTSRVLPQVPREPMDFAYGAIHGSNNLQPLATDGMNPGLLPSICPPARPFDSRQDVVDPTGDWFSFSSANSNMNYGSWLQSIPAMDMAPFMGTQEEIALERCLLTHLSTLQSLDPRWVEEIAKWGNLPQ